MKGAAQNRRAQRQASGFGLGRAMWAAEGVVRVWALVGLVRTEASGGGGGSAEPAEPFRLTLEESGSHEMRLHWPGKAEHTYFLQSSENLVDWVYEPTIFAGEHYGPEHDRHEVQITPQSARGFFRAIRTEHHAADPWWADFDGDGIPNGIELLIGYDPLKADSLGDGVSDGQRDSHAIGIPDWWQLLHFGETGIDPNALSANGVHTILQVYHQGGDPHDPDLPNQAVPWDPRATWDRAPESRYVALGPGTLYTLTHLSVPLEVKAPPSSTVLFHTHGGGLFPNKLPLISVIVDQTGIARTEWITHGDAVADNIITVRSPQAPTLGEFGITIVQLKLRDLPE